MDEKSRVYIFHIGEILLIILLIVLMTAFSFTMGYRVGKAHTDKVDGFTVEDKELAKSGDVPEIKSDVEEDVEKKIADFKKTEEAPTTKDSESKDQEENKTDTYNALKEAFNKMDTEKPEVEVEEEKEESSEPEMTQATVEAKKATQDKDLKQDDLGDYTGKHTIQLGSYQTVDEAKKFASGFKVRGYNPIIYEVKLDGKGIWYRVNLGVFNSVSEAKEYIEKESSLFKGTDYVIGVF